MKPIPIGLVGFNGVQALDLVGPSDAFTLALGNAGESSIQSYEIQIIGLTDKSFVAESGVVLKTPRAIEGVQGIDTVIVPGGEALREESTSALIADWIASVAR